MLSTWLGIGGGVLALATGQALYFWAKNRKKKLDAECSKLKGAKAADKRIVGERFNNRLFHFGSLLTLAGFLVALMPAFNLIFG